MRTRRPVTLALEDVTEVTTASSAGDLMETNMSELGGGVLSSDRTSVRSMNMERST
jgi:hypothetical protein